MKKTKYRLLAAVLAIMCCMAAFSMSALATDGGYYQSNEDGDNIPPSSIDSISVSTEGVTLPENQGGEALTPDGNLSLIDDIFQDEGYYVSDEKIVKDKQFITVQSKSGNYFYIIIDRSGDTENVFFLNMVDEADLMALMEDGESEETVLSCTCKDKCAAGEVNTDCSVCKTNMSECIGKEKVTEPTPKPDETPDVKPDGEKEKSGNNSGLLLIVLLLAIGGGGALYWFKFRKPKPDTKGPADLDDYDYGEDDEDDYETEKEDAAPDDTDAEDADE